MTHRGFRARVIFGGVLAVVALRDARAGGMLNEVHAERALSRRSSSKTAEAWNKLLSEIQAQHLGMQLKPRFEDFERVLISARPWVARDLRAEIDRSLEGTMSAKTRLVIHHQPALGPAEIYWVANGVDWIPLFRGQQALVQNPEAGCTENICDEPSRAPTPALVLEARSKPVTLASSGKKLRSYEVKLVAVTNLQREQIARHFGLNPALRGPASLSSHKEEVDLKDLLPPSARAVLNQFPEAKLLRDGNGPNCYSSVRSFYKETVEAWSDASTSKTNFQSFLDRHYCATEFKPNDPVSFGDILVDWREGHAVRALFREPSGRLWVYSKASGSALEPWRVLPLNEAFSGPLEARLDAYRRCR